MDLVVIVEERNAPIDFAHANEEWYNTAFLSLKYVSANGRLKEKGFRDPTMLNYDQVYTEKGFITKPASWDSAKKDWFKLDTDASVTADGLGITYGISLRLNLGQGNVQIIRLGSGHRLMDAPSIVKAEAYGLYRGVRRVVELIEAGFEIPRLRISNDNQTVVDWVEGTVDLIPADGEEIIQLVGEINHLLDNNFERHNREVTQKNREGLFMADYLSSLGLPLPDGHEVFYNNFFDFTSRYIHHRDIHGPPYAQVDPKASSQLTAEEKTMRKAAKVAKRKRMKKELKKMDPQQRAQKRARKTLKNQRKRQRRAGRNAADGAALPQ